MSAAAVLKSERKWHVECADAVAFLKSLPDDSIDLLVTSPPYEAARTYGIGQKISGQAWVDWMMEVFRAAAPKVKGLITMNCEGQTRNYKYSATPFLLAADLHRAGFNLRKPVVFHRVGIPGSGGPDWLRNDWEPIVCVSRGKLPWSDNTACGHPPKWAPGGEMAHRLSNGKRVNQWGPVGSRNGAGKRFHHGEEASEKQQGPRPSHVRLGTGQDLKGSCAVVPAIANPGNVLAINVGGGMMGSQHAHANEAPFPLDLPAFFVKSFCPPNGVVADCFSGSGTTLHAAIENGRRFVGCDIRQSQVDLCRRRIRSVTPSLAFTPLGWAAPSSQSP